MTVADLIAELRRYPGHLQIACALDADYWEMHDHAGQPYTATLSPDLDCLGLTEIRNQGTWLQLIGGGYYYGESE